MSYERWCDAARRAIGSRIVIVPKPGAVALRVRGPWAAFAGRSQRCESSWWLMLSPEGAGGGQF